MSIVLKKPTNYSGPEFQTSIFLPVDNFKLFTFQPTTSMVEPYKSANEASSWNDKHVTKFNIVNESQKSMAVKTIPIEIIEGAVKASNIEGISLWTTVKSGKGEDKIKTEVFNNKLKYTCKGGIITCHGEV